MVACIDTLSRSYDTNVDNEAVRNGDVWTPGVFNISHDLNTTLQGVNKNCPSEGIEPPTLNPNGNFEQISNEATSFLSTQGAVGGLPENTQGNDPNVTQPNDSVNLVQKSGLNRVPNSVGITSLDPCIHEVGAVVQRFDGTFEDDPVRGTRSHSNVLGLGSKSNMPNDHIENTSRRFDEYSDKEPASGTRSSNVLGLGTRSSNVLGLGSNIAHVENASRQYDNFSDKEPARGTRSSNVLGFSSKLPDSRSDAVLFEESRQFHPIGTMEMSRNKPWPPVGIIGTEPREAFRPSFILNQDQRSRASSMDSNLRPIRPKTERKSIIPENSAHRQGRRSHLSSRSSSEESNRSRNRSKPKVYQNMDVRPKITSNLTNNFKNEPNPSLFQNMGTGPFETTVSGAVA